MTLLINEQPLQVIPALAKKVGLNEALVLQQMHFWLDPREDISFFEKQYWLDSIYDRCLVCFCMWNEGKIRRILQSLEEQGYLVFSHKGTPRREYVTIDYKLLPSSQRELHQFRDCGLNYLINTATRQTEAVSPEGKTDKPDMSNLKKMADPMIRIWNDPAHTYLQPEDSISLTPERAHKLTKFLISQWLLEGIPWVEFCQEANRKGSQEKNQNEEATDARLITLDWALIPKNAKLIAQGIRKNKS